MISMERLFSICQPLTALLVGVLVSLTVKYYFCRRIFKLGSKLPGPKCWPFVGNLFDVIDLKWTGVDCDALSTMNKFHKTYDLYRLWFGHQLNVFFRSPEDAEIFCNSYDLLDRSEKLSIINPIMGKGLLFGSGEEWKKAKKIMNSTFPSLMVKDFGSLIQAKCEILVQHLRKEVGKTNFLMFPYVRNCAFDIICKGAFEIDSRAQEEGKEELEFLKAVHFIKKLTMKRMIFIWQQPDCLYKVSRDGQNYKQFVDTMYQTFDEYIENKMKYMEEKEDNGNTGKESKKLFWEKLFANKNLSKEEIRHHLYTIIVTGYESSANTICIILALLALHPDVQEKAYDELISIISDGIFNNEKLRKLEYLERVINESIRLFPTVPIIARKSKADVQFGKHLVPAGSEVLFNIWALHRDPNQFENPNQFNPDNFLPENVSKRHPYAYRPFSAGPRKCIGNKFAIRLIKIVIGSILMNYKIECDYKKMEDIPVRVEVTTAMEDDCPLRLLNR